MPQFLFQARDAHGADRTGEVEAAGPSAAVSDLRSRGWVIVDLRPAPGPVAAAQPSSRRAAARGFLPAKSFDVEMGFRQIAAMLRSGVTLLTALRTAEEQARRPAAARVWGSVAEDVMRGSSFAQAIGRFPRLFGPFVTALVQVGEQSGSTDLVLVRAVEHLERVRRLRTTVVTAMVYPAMVLLMALGVTIFMLVGIIPKIEGVLRSSGRRLPAMTQTLVDLSASVRIYWPWLFGVAVLAGAAILFLWHWEPTRAVLDRWLLRLPVIGGVLRVSATAAFARGLGLLLESGINLVDALQTAASLMSNRHLRRRVLLSHQAVLQGDTLAGSLSDKTCFTPMLPRMAAVAEASGRLDAALDEVARYHEEQLAVQVRRLSVLVEPATIVLVGSIVGFVYISFFLALMAVSGGVR